MEKLSLVGEFVLGQEVKVGGHVFVVIEVCHGGAVARQKAPRSEPHNPGGQPVTTLRREGGR